MTIDQIRIPVIWWQGDDRTFGARAAPAGGSNPRYPPNVVAVVGLSAGDYRRIGPSRRRRQGNDLSALAFSRGSVSGGECPRGGGDGRRDCRRDPCRSGRGGPASIPA